MKLGRDLRCHNCCDVPGGSEGGGRGPGGTMEAPTLTVVCHEGRPPVHAVFLPDGCCPQPVPCWSACPAPGRAEETRAADRLAGLLAVGIAAVTAGSRLFAAIGQWGAGAGAGVLAGLGAVRGPAGEPTFRRAFALIGADVPGQVVGAWFTPGRRRPRRRAGSRGRRVARPSAAPGTGKGKPRTSRGPGARYRRGPRRGRRGREAQ